MAGFQTHIATSSTLGVLYGVGGATLGIPVPTCVLAGALCGVSGMLPDLDSDNGVPLRETTGFLAAVVPMLMLDRFHRLELTHEQMVLAAAGVYAFIRFVVAEIFRRYTKHRGMWHSIPAALSCGLICYLLCQCSDTDIRMFKSFAVVLGFLSHLVLDEIYSFERRGVRVRVKKSSGTALKWFGDSAWANVTTYAKLGLLIFFAFFADDHVMNYLAPKQGLQPFAQHSKDSANPGVLDPEFWQAATPETRR